MNQPKKFLEDIENVDGRDLDQRALDDVAPILREPNFNYETMSKKSFAASYLCNWVINIVKYNTIYKKVKPLMDSAEEAERTASEKGEELRVVQEKVRVVVEKVEALR